MTSAKLLLGYLLHRSAVQAHMPWMMLSEEGRAVNLYFGEGIVPSPSMITMLDGVDELELINANGTEKVAIQDVGGYKHGDLPADYASPATVAGFLDYGEYQPGVTLLYSFTTQASSDDAAADWAGLFQDFSWVEELFGDTGYANPPLFATLKNFGGPPYELAVNGMPGMTSIQGCLYYMDADTGAEVEMGCTEHEVQDYDGASMVVEIESTEPSPEAGQVYFFRVRTKDVHDSVKEVAVSSYATGSATWAEAGDDHDSHDHDSLDNDSHDLDSNDHDDEGSDTTPPESLRGTRFVTE